MRTETIFEGQADYILEENYEALLDEIIQQLYEIYGNFYDDSQLRFKIKIEKL